MTERTLSIVTHNQSRNRSLLQLMQRHVEQGSLTVYLKQLRIETLETWEDALFTELGSKQDYKSYLSEQRPPSRATRSKFETISEPRDIDVNKLPAAGIKKLIGSISSSMPDNADIHMILCCRIYLLVEATIRSQDPNVHREIKIWLDELLPMTRFSSSKATPSELTDFALGNRGNGSPNSHLRETENDTRTQTGLRIKANEVNGLAGRLGSPTKVSVASVLPFLMLNALEKAGYLDIVNGALRASELDDLLSPFAAALAYKALDTPQRGWQRSGASKQVAAAFAGLSGVAAEKDIQLLANHASKFASALNAQISGELVGNAVAQDSLCVAKVEAADWQKIYVGDVQGHFPIALLDSAQEVRQLLMRWESPSLLVDSTLSNPNFLRKLDTFGIQFLIVGPPTRGENLRVIRNRNGTRFSTNDFVTSSKKLARLGGRLERCHESVNEYWIEMACNRLAAPLASNRELEDALSLAAGVGLAQIGWDLWREDEETHPVLALNRFSDLSGVVSFQPDRVHVTIPLGKRAMDLAAKNYLDDIPNVPWLDGRPITFSQG